ncbi:MAG: rRNA maturation RNase YbeY [Chromatiales bacterium]
MRLEVAVQYATSRRGLPHPNTVRKWARAALAGRRQGGQVTVRFVLRSEGAWLNRRWRQQPGATNVLSFPGESWPGLPSWLGDIVICVPVIRAEARIQGKSVNAHCAHMIVHAALHLVGCDHRHLAEAAAMEKCETAILNKLGYPDPYRVD